MNSLARNRRNTKQLWTTPEGIRTLLRLKEIMHHEQWFNLTSPRPDFTLDGKDYMSSRYNYCIRDTPLSFLHLCTFPYSHWLMYFYRKAWRSLPEYVIQVTMRFLSTEPGDILYGIERDTTPAYMKLQLCSNYTNPIDQWMNGVNRGDVPSIIKMFLCTSRKEFKNLFNSYVSKMSRKGNRIVNSQTITVGRSELVLFYKVLNYCSDHHMETLSRRRAVHRSFAENYVIIFCLSFKSPCVFFPQKYPNPILEHYEMYPRFQAYYLCQI